MLHERLPHVQAGDRLYRAAIADLLNFIEVARPTDSRSKERWKTQQAYWAVNTASCLLSLCEKNGSLSELGRQWYETETPAGSTVLSHVLRSIASLQRVESLAPFWLSILESKDLHKVAVPAFYGLMRSVEQDARVALHFLARARELANNSDSFAAALISFMSHEYLHTGEVCRSEVPNELASEEGALPERIKFRRTLDDGDIAIMFQGIPRDRREAFVSRVFDVLIQGKALSEDRADHLKSIAMRAAPKYVFLDAVDSTRFTRWPAFHLLHWPVWAHEWSDRIDAIWINLEMSAQIGPRENPTLPCRWPSVVDRPQGRGVLDADLLQRLLQPIVRRWKPMVILAVRKITPQLRDAVKPDVVLPSEMEWQEVDHVLSIFLPDKLPQPSFSGPGTLAKEPLRDIAAAMDAVVHAPEPEHHDRAASRARKQAERMGLNWGPMSDWEKLALFHDLIPDGQEAFAIARKAVQGDAEQILNWAKSQMIKLLNRPPNERHLIDSLGAKQLRLPREDLDSWKALVDSDLPWKSYDKLVEQAAT